MPGHPYNAQNYASVIYKSLMHVHYFVKEVLLAWCEHSPVGDLFLQECHAVEYTQCHAYTHNQLLACYETYIMYTYYM